MRRKSERNKAKPAEKKPEPSPKKSRRSSRRRKRSTSRSSSEDSDDVPLKVAPEIVEPVVVKPEEQKKPSSHSNSEEDKDEQPIWKVKTSDVSSGEIQKLKICLQRPSTTPERTEKSPRRRRGKTSSQSDEASLTPDEKIYKRKSRNSPSLNTSEGSSLDNSAIEVAEKEESLIIIKETNEIIIGKGKLDSSQTKQDSENEKYVQDSQIEENAKESQNELAKKGVTVECKTDQDSHAEENTVEKQKQINVESSNKQTDKLQHSEDNKMEEETLNDDKKESVKPQLEEKVDEISTPKEKDSKDKKSDAITIPENSINNESQAIVEEDSKKEETIKCFEIDATILNYSNISEEINKSAEAKDTTVEEDNIVEQKTIKEVSEKTELSENKETSVEKMEISNESAPLLEITDKPASPKEKEEEEEKEKPKNESEESTEIQDIITEKVENADKKIDEPSIEIKDSNDKNLEKESPDASKESELPAKVEETSEEFEETSKVLEDLNKKIKETIEKLDDSFNMVIDIPENVTEIKANTSDLNKNADIVEIEEDCCERVISPKRKWGKYKVSLSNEERITLNSISLFCPLVKMLTVEELKLEKHDSREYEPKLPKRDRYNDKNKDTVEMPFPSKNEDDLEKEVSNIGLNRKISIVNDEASKLQPPPSPANNPLSAILYITNLVRPFTLKQLQELLSRTGKITEDGFWTDKIKSKCYVEYETEEEAEATRNALHGVQWPTGNGKKLVIDFATTESMKAARNVNIEIPVVIKSTQDEISEKNTENKESVVNDQRWDNQRTTAPVREWDLGKVPQDFRDRSRSKDRMDNRSDRAEKRRPSRNESPSNGDQLTSRKKTKKEETEVKLMDDLFHKTKATPSIYWLPLSPEQIAKKQQQRLQRMAEHKRRMEESRRFDRDRDFGRGGGGPRARRRSARYDGD